MKYVSLTDEQLHSLRNYVTYDMPAGREEKLLTLLVLEQAKRANALADEVSKVLQVWAGTCPSPVLDALAAYLGEE